MHNLIKYLHLKLSWGFLTVLFMITLVSCKEDSHYKYFRRNVNDIHFAIFSYNLDFKTRPINTDLDTKTELFEKLSGKNIHGSNYLIDEHFFNEVEIFGTDKWLIITYPGEDNKYNTADDLIGRINIENPPSHKNPVIFKVNELVEFD